MTVSAIYTCIGCAASAVGCAVGAKLQEGPIRGVLGLLGMVQGRIASEGIAAKMFGYEPSIPIPGFYKYIGVTVIQGSLFGGAAYWAYNKVSENHPMTMYNLKRITLFAPFVLGVVGSGSILAFGAARTAQVAAPIFWHFVAAPLAGVIAGTLAARYV